MYFLAFSVPLKYAKALIKKKKTWTFQHTKKTCRNGNFWVKEEDISREERTYGNLRLNELHCGCKISDQTKTGLSYILFSIQL